MQIHPMIEDTATLAAMCARIAKSNFIAVDTEFMRENTFWPDLRSEERRVGKEC